MAKRERARSTEVARAPAAAPGPKLDLEPVMPVPAPTAPFEKRKKYSIWFLPSIYKSIQHEAIDREMSVGEVLEEAMHARIMLVRRGDPTK